MKACRFQRLIHRQYLQDLKRVRKRSDNNLNSNDNGERKPQINTILTISCQIKQLAFKSAPSQRRNSQQIFKLDDSGLR